MACQFPRSESSGMRGKTELLLEAEWLLEALSKQSFGSVNSGAYLAITASRCFMSQTTCYGNAFSLSLILSLFLLRKEISPLTNTILASEVGYTPLSFILFTHTHLPSG